MRALPSLLVLASVLAFHSAAAQTTGVPGVADFSLNGIGSGGTSPVAVQVGIISAQMSFQVTGAPGSSLIGAFGPSAPGILNLGGGQSLDVFPPTIWLDPSVTFGQLPFPLGVIPLSGTWTLDLLAGLPPGGGPLTAFQFAVVNPTLPNGFQLTQAIDVTSVPPLPTTVLDMELQCPSQPGGLNGVTFSGGGGCLFAALPFCYSTGIRSYRIASTDAPLNITFAADVLTLTMFYALQTVTDASTITFFDQAGNQVGTPASAIGNCLTAMPLNLAFNFPTAVRSAQVVTTAGTAWIDTMAVN